MKLINKLRNEVYNNFPLPSKRNIKKGKLKILLENSSTKTKTYMKMIMINYSRIQIKGKRNMIFLVIYNT